MRIAGKEVGQVDAVQGGEGLRKKKKKDREASS